MLRYRVTRRVLPVITRFNVSVSEHRSCSKWLAERNKRIQTAPPGSLDIKASMEKVITIQILLVWLWYNLIHMIYHTHYIHFIRALFSMSVKPSFPPSANPDIAIVKLRCHVRSATAAEVIMGFCWSFLDSLYRWWFQTFDRFLLCTLQGINISHLGKRKLIFKTVLERDMLVPRRVIFSFFVWDPGIIIISPDIYSILPLTRGDDPIWLYNMFISSVAHGRWSNLTDIYFQMLSTYLVCSFFRLAYTTNHCDIVVLKALKADQRWLRHWVPECMDVKDTFAFHASKALCFCLQTKLTADALAKLEDHRCAESSCCFALDLYTQCLSDLPSCRNKDQKKQ